MSIGVNIDNITLDIISSRLKRSVSTLDILKWVANFKQDEHQLAINILLNMTVYSTYEIEETLNESFSEIFPKLKKNEELLVLPVGLFGKSGTLISYFFQRTSYFQRHKKSEKIHLIAEIVDFQFAEGVKYHLVLIDDFIGSGKTVATYCTDIVNKWTGSFDSINYFGIAGMKVGIQNISPLFDNVKIPKSNVFEKCFSPKGSDFGYRKQVPYREMAFKYGKLLTKPVFKNNAQVRFPNALGFENSQALVSFSYGSPNNTLPIIWANDQNWFPLIPRFSVDKINSAREFRKDISHELSMLKEFGSENIRDTFFSFEIKRGKKTFTSVSKLDFSLYSIIKLSREGFLPVNICHRLGIFYNDYERLISEGFKKGIFKRNGELSDWGLEIYAEAKKSIEKAKKVLRIKDKNTYEVKVLNYLPKTFNGKS